MPRDRLKTIRFALAANGIAALLLFALGEVVVRWRHADDLPGSGPRWLIADAMLGYTLDPARPGINSLGIRNGEISRDKPPGLFRVIVLGDSVAWDQRGFVTMVRDRLASTHVGPSEVINAAIPGYTTYQERLLLERDFLGTSPDLVILQYCLNDNHRFLHKVSASGQWLVTPEAEAILEPDQRLALPRLLQSSRLLTSVRLRLLALRPFERSPFPWDRRPDFAAAWQDQTWPDIEEQLRSIRDDVHAIGARFAVVVVPFEPQLQDDLLSRDRVYTLKPQRKLHEIGARLGVPLLDVYDVFLANRSRQLFRDGIHLTPAGHDVVAQELMTFMPREKL